MNKLTQTFIKSLKFYGASPVSAREIAEDLIEDVKKYNQKTRQFFIKENTTPEEVLKIVVNRQEKYL